MVCGVTTGMEEVLTKEVILAKLDEALRGFFVLPHYLYQYKYKRCYFWQPRLPVPIYVYKKRQYKPRGKAAEILYRLTFEFRLHRQRLCLDTLRSDWKSDPEYRADNGEAKPRRIPIELQKKAGRKAVASSEEILARFKGIDKPTMQTYEEVGKEFGLSVSGMKKAYYRAKNHFQCNDAVPVL